MTKFFDNMIEDFEMSLRGQIEVNNKKFTALPHFASSKFISKIVSQLKTIANINTIYANLSEKIIKKRIYSNGDSLVLAMVLDESVKSENFLTIFESFQNISIDVYYGMKMDGKYGKLQKELKENNYEERQDDEVLAA
jgi:hypothetical protein